MVSEVGLDIEKKSLFTGYTERDGRRKSLSQLVDLTTPGHNATARVEYRTYY
jgi:hypothetical protein